MKILVSSILFFVASFQYATAQQLYDSKTNGKLNIIVGDVGQGDGILIRCPHGTHEILIDSGGLNSQYPQSRELFERFIGTYQDPGNPIEMVVASHPHADHIGNMDFVLNTYEVQNYVDNGFTYNSATYDNVMALVRAETGLQYHPVKDATPTVSFCSQVSVTIVRPEGFEVANSNANDRSVIVKLEYGDKSFLFVGDCEEGEEEMILEDDYATALIKDIDFLKAGHHGSNTSSTAAFLQEVDPQIVAVSAGRTGVGKNYQYKHPRQEVLNRFQDHAGIRQGNIQHLTEFNSTSRDWEDIKLDRAVYVTKNQGDLIFISTKSTITRVIYK